MGCLCRCLSNCYPGYHTSPIKVVDGWIKMGQEQFDCKAVFPFPPIAVTQLTKSLDLTQVPLIERGAINAHLLATHVFIEKRAYDKEQKCKFVVFHNGRRVDSTFQTYGNAVDALKKYVGKTELPILSMRIESLSKNCYGETLNND